MLLTLKSRRLYFDLVGPEKAPVVCCCHSLSSDGGMWAEQVPPLLAAGFRVLRLDMRGHGGSDPVAGDYTMKDLADDVVAVLDHLGLQKVHYIGLSIGGMLGQALAIHHGDSVLSAIWCDTTPQTPAGSKATWADRMATVKKAGSLEPMADQTMERWFSDAWKPKHQARWKEIRGTIAGTTPAGYVGCAAAIANFDFVPQLPKLKLPVLVICGSDDVGTPPAANRQIAALVPGGRYEEIATARHFPNVEFPDIFNKLMLDWLVQQR